MSDLATTQAKLRTTPTAGVSSEHSAYYRRLLSKGYKGYVQGSIGGGSLYGLIGLSIGGVVGLAAAPFTGGASLWLIPALAGGFGLYGAHAFADIGKTAAIIADSAETNEKRRYLFDRYYETPSEAEAAEIRRQLEEDHKPKPVESLFHWKPALIGALIGVTLAVVTVALISQGIAPHFMLEGFEILMHALHVPFTAGTPLVGQALTAALPALGGLVATAASIGGLAGSSIGIDGEYIRRWMDGAEFTVHDIEDGKQSIIEREQNIRRLALAAQRGDGDVEARAGEKPAQRPQLARERPDESNQARPHPVSPETIAGVSEKPAAKIVAIKNENRVEPKNEKQLDSPAAMTL